MKRTLVMGAALVLLAWPASAQDAKPIAIEVTTEEANFLAELIDASCKQTGIIRGTCRNGSSLIERIGKAAAATAAREKTDAGAIAKAKEEAETKVKELQAELDKAKAEKP